jgi:hypothetical protein
MPAKFSSEHFHFLSLPKIKIRTYKSMILSVVLNGRETWSLKKSHETGWRKEHNEKLHNLYGTSSKIKMMKSWKIRWAEHVERICKEAELMWVIGG